MNCNVGMTKKEREQGRDDKASKDMSESTGKYTDHSFLHCHCKSIPITHSYIVTVLITHPYIDYVGD